MITKKAEDLEHNQSRVYALYGSRAKNWSNLPLETPPVISTISARSTVACPAVAHVTTNPVAESPTTSERT
jgi:hypothetical protein